MKATKPSPPQKTAKPRERKTRADVLKKCHEHPSRVPFKPLVEVPAGVPLAVGLTLTKAIEQLAQQNWWGAHEETETLGRSPDHQICSNRTRWTAGTFQVISAHVPGGTAILEFAKVD